MDRRRFLLTSLAGAIAAPPGNPARTMLPHHRAPEVTPALSTGSDRNVANAYRTSEMMDGLNA